MSERLERYRQLNKLFDESQIAFKAWQVALAKAKSLRTPESVADASKARDEQRRLREEYRTFRDQKS